MRKCISVFILVTAGLMANAQYNGFSPVKDPEKFRLNFTQAAQKTNSIKSDFTQEKILSMLSEKIVSKGKFWFKKESRVRMEYTQPYQYLMILNKDKVYVKDGQKENKVSTRSNKVFQQINKIMVDCMQGTMLNNPDFKTRIFENKGQFLVELVPVTKGLKDLFKAITVTIENRDFSVAIIEMQELSGDNTIIRFINKDLNADIQDKLFVIL